MIAGAQEYFKRTLSEDRRIVRWTEGRAKSGKKAVRKSRKTPAPGSKPYPKLDYSHLIAKKKKIVNEKACPGKPICELKDYRRQTIAI